MNESGTFRIASADLSSPRILNWTANKRFGNAEQACPDGYAGDPIPAGTYYADTQEAANALAAADLVCVLAWQWESFDTPSAIEQAVVWSNWEEQDD
jgi:hypothetical protein